MIEQALRKAETRLRAIGLTGEAAFQALIQSVTARIDGRAEHPELVDLVFPTTGVDLTGLAYERFFPDLFKGRLGQYFTPPSLVRLLLSRLPIQRDADVLDPTCGSGGLLVAAARAGARVRGFDIDPRLVELARLNLRLADHPAHIERADFFTRTPRPAQILIANPPFSVPIRDPVVLASYGIEDREQVVSDVLFLQALGRWLVPGGWAAVIVPWTVIANPRMQPVRDRIDAQFERHATLALPEGVFRAFGGAQGRAAMLWLQRRPCPVPVQRSWATLTDPGYDTRSKLLRRTSDAEVECLLNGVGWVPCSGWLPQHERLCGTLVRSFAEVRTGTTIVSGTTQIIELGDVDPRTHEALPRRVELHARRQELCRDEVLVARMRPERGNVTISPIDGHGSPEWIRLACEHPHVLLHALRSPTWRNALPPTTGQTRPRTDKNAVLASRVRLPSPGLCAQLETLSRTLHQQRRDLAVALTELQAIVDAHQAGAIDDDALQHRLLQLRQTLAGETP